MARLLQELTLDLSVSTAWSNAAEHLFARISAEEGRGGLALGALLVRVAFVLANHDLGARRELVGAVVHPARAAGVAVVAAVAAILAVTGGVVGGLVTAVFGSHPGEVLDEGSVVGALLGEVLHTVLLAQESIGTNAESSRVQKGLRFAPTWVKCN